MTDFTPWASFGGGALIGLAAVLLLALHGRILGATGILAGLLRPDDGPDFTLRAALIAGMVAGPLVLVLLGGPWPATAAPVPPWAVALGGLIVGLGVSYGGGCTSGHGVCGLARLSLRSLVATLTFMTTSVLTVYLTRHGLGG